jgi:hypothetical protein
LQVKRCVAAPELIQEQKVDISRTAGMPSKPTDADRAAPGRQRGSEAFST